jgi:hypothetical protein
VGEAKAALLKEWDEHLQAAHPRQWEQEQKEESQTPGPKGADHFEGRGY